MVTMATTSVTPAKPRLDQPATKFTAVKVDVSRLTSSHSKSKVFVVSSKTTSRDLTDMVMRKLKVDERNKKTCLLGEKPGGGRVLLEADDRVLKFYGSHSRKAPTFELIPADAVDPIMMLTSLAPTPRDGADVIKAGNLSNSRNGMTLPGYKKTTEAGGSVLVGEGFLTSTPNPDCDSLPSPADSGFMIHYEPYNGVNDVRRTRSKSFELARENSCAGHGNNNNNKLDLSGNASDSGLIINGNGLAAIQNDVRPENGLDDYPYRPSPQDGFQILQSKHSAWKPFDRHASDGLLKGISQQSSLLANSVPDVRERQPISGVARKGAVQRRRSLPRMSVSQEELNEKKRSVTDSFVVKLRLFLDKSRKSVDNKPSDQRVLLLSNVASRDDDDTVSVTSQEVAEILSAASPLKPYEEDDVTESDESRPDHSPNDDNYKDTRTKRKTPDNVFQPLADTSPLSADDDDVDESPRHQSEHLSRVDVLVKEAMGSFAAQPANRRSGSDPDHKVGAAYTSQYSPPDPRVPHRSVNRQESGYRSRGVPLYTLLSTHLLAPVRLQNNRHSSSHFFGVRLCDVTYAKCVRHVLRHWEVTSKRFSVDPELADNMLVAVGGIDKHSTSILSGKLFRGDIIVEVNGFKTLQMSARDVIHLMTASQMVSIVVARSRLNVERAQSP